jgi:hypothetical protein
MRALLVTKKKVLTKELAITIALQKDRKEQFYHKAVMTVTPFRAVIERQHNMIINIKRIEKNSCIIKRS